MKRLTNVEEFFFFLTKIMLYEKYALQLIIGSLQIFSEDYRLASHITQYYVCYFFHVQLFTIDPERQILCNYSRHFVIYSWAFAGNLLRGIRLWIVFIRDVIKQFDFRFFYFCYVCILVYYICWQYQTVWIVSLFLTDKKVSRVLVCSSMFYYRVRQITFFLENA